ncbi:unnamed protein product [Closterium sp. NIES-54]
MVNWWKVRRQSMRMVGRRAAWATERRRKGEAKGKGKGREEGDGKQEGRQKQEGVDDRVHGVGTGGGVESGGRGKDEVRILGRDGDGSDEGYDSVQGVEESEGVAEGEEGDGSGEEEGYLEREGELEGSWREGGEERMEGEEGAWSVVDCWDEEEEREREGVRGGEEVEDGREDGREDEREDEREDGREDEEWCSEQWSEVPDRGDGSEVDVVDVDRVDPTQEEEVGGERGEEGEGEGETGVKEKEEGRRKERVSEEQEVGSTAEGATAMEGAEMKGSDGAELEEQGAEEDGDGVGGNKRMGSRGEEGEGGAVPSDKGQDERGKEDLLPESMRGEEEERRDGSGMGLHGGAGDSSNPCESGVECAEVRKQRAGVISASFPVASSSTTGAASALTDHNPSHLLSASSSSSSTAAQASCLPRVCPSSLVASPAAVCLPSFHSSAQWVSHVLDHASVGFALLDPSSSRLLACNAALASLLAAPPSLLAPGLLLLLALPHHHRAPFQKWLQGCVSSSTPSPPPLTLPITHSGKQCALGSASLLPSEAPSPSHSVTFICCPAAIPAIIHPATLTSAPVAPAAAAAAAADGAANGAASVAEGTAVPHHPDLPSPRALAVRPVTLIAMLQK